MEGEIRIIILDDHPVLLKGIEAIFQEINDSDFNFRITTKTNCDDTYRLIKESLHIEPFDILFTDLSFNKNHSNKIRSGEELIRILNKEAPNLKKGIITRHSETNRVFNCIENLNPLTYLLKDCLNKNELNFAVHKMLKGEKYYTNEVHRKILKRSIIKISLDEISLQILHELRKHSKISNLVGHILTEKGKTIQSRTIEKKLSDLRLALDAKNNTDLVLKAKEFGLID
jgi:DNA-binding NarL/FixJ family response regulator